MALEITMPKLGLTMTEGTVVEWTVESGQAVSAGDTIAFIETEKVNVDLEAEADGVLQHVVPAGETVLVEGLIGYLLEPGEDPVAG